MVYQRFERDLAQVSTFYKLEDNTEIDHLRSIDIMIQMGFLNDRSTIDKDVVYKKLWDDMSAPKDAADSQKINLKTLKAYMCAIQNFLLPQITEA